MVYCHASVGIIFTEMSLTSVNFFLIFSTIIRPYIASVTMETWLVRRDKPAYANEVYGELFYAIGLSPGEEWRRGIGWLFRSVTKKK